MKKKKTEEVKEELAKELGEDEKTIRLGKKIYAMCMWFKTNEIPISYPLFFSVRQTKKPLEQFFKKFAKAIEEKLKEDKPFSNWIRSKIQ